MKFNLKLFVLVGILAGLRDVWGRDVAAGFYVNKTASGNKDLADAVSGRRVIRAVYKTGIGGNVSIMRRIYFEDKLFKMLVYAGKEDAGVDVDNFDVDDNGKLCYDMKEKVEYTVYFIFKKECFDGTAEKLLKSTSSMFQECSKLIHADFRYFDTTNIKNMSFMFHKCYALTGLDLSKFDTTNVKCMAYMFKLCTVLKELDLSKFDTTKVTDMSNMLCGCYALNELNLSSFDTKNVTNMEAMFAWCSSLTKLDLSNFNTKKVTNMSFMFDGCSSLSELNLSSFDTSNVTNMSYVFQGCSALTELNLGNFNFSCFGNIRGIFWGCDFDNLSIPQKYKYIRKKFWCCGDIVDGYVHEV